MLVNGILTASPLQIVEVAVLVMVELGFTITAMACGVPGQFPDVDVGVTVYVTISAEAVLFVIVLIKGFPVCVVRLSPVVFILSAAIHEYVEVTLLVNGILTVPILQIVAPVEVMVGVGITLTLKICGTPKQP